MCKGMEKYTLRTQIEAFIKSFRSMNLDEDEIVKRVAEFLMSHKIM